MALEAIHGTTGVRPGHAGFFPESSYFSCDEFQFFFLLSRAKYFPVSYTNETSAPQQDRVTVTFP